MFGNIRLLSPILSRLYHVFIPFCNDKLLPPTSDSYLTCRKVDIAFFLNNSIQLYEAQFVILHGPCDLACHYTTLPAWVVNVWFSPPAQHNRLFFLRDHRCNKRPFLRILMSGLDKFNQKSLHVTGKMLGCHLLPSPMK